MEEELKPVSLTLIPRLILHVNSPGMTDATVTVAPHRVNVSVMQVVSISSLPSPIGTSTCFVIWIEEEENARGIVLLAGTKALLIFGPRMKRAMCAARDIIV